MIEATSPKAKADYAGRLEREIARQPIFDEYPPLPDLDFAIRVVLETVEEMDWADDKHAWCHSRPVWLALLQAAVGASPQKRT